VEEVVAVEVGLADGQSRYFITWGRIQGGVAYGAVADLVARAAAEQYGMREIAFTRVCGSLREAAEAAEAEHFYEGLARFASVKIPQGRRSYKRWRKRRAKAMEQGREIYYCGGQVTDSEEWLSAIKTTLVLLAEPAAEQRAYLESRDIDDAQELLALRGMHPLSRSLLSSSQRLALGAVEQTVRRLDASIELHTVAALNDADEWQHLREEARAALNELGSTA
jgi:hypothetical protein